MGSVTRFVIAHGKRIAVETAPDVWSPKRKRAKAAAFVKLERSWVERLKGTKNPAMLFVVYYVLEWRFKNSNRPVPVSNEAMRAFGVAPKAKWGAMRTMARRGLIRIEVKKGQAPRAIVL